MNSFQARGELRVGDQRLEIYRLPALADHGHDVARLPYSIRILLENLLRREDGHVVTAADVEALAGWADHGRGTEPREITFMPARVLLQDFTGVPTVVDLAAMRDAMADLGGDPTRVNPRQPVELVIDHSVQVDSFAVRRALELNQDRDYERNAERYGFLKWGREAFANFKVVPPNTGICHQVNLEYLGRVVSRSDEVEDHGARGGAGGDDASALPQAYPDTVVGTDSHTPMINGLGVLGWGVGGIEAEAAMLGQPISMLVPEVIGFRLDGQLTEGTTATDLVLTVCEMLRKKGVVGKFVEFHGPGLASLTLADRATIGNMTPEYGATCAIFPVDAVTLDYLRFTGRSAEQVALVEAYMKEQGLFHTASSPEPVYTDTLELDLGSVEPSIAGPRRPQDRLPLREAGTAFRDTLPSLLPEGGRLDATVTTSDGHTLRHGSVVIAAITSCTNTSNPAVMLAAGLVARKAVQRGLRTRPWVKTSLAPGSMVVTDYLRAAGLQDDLDALGFQLVGYGCTTCIGNSGPLPEPVAAAIAEADLVAASVLSGNRNFEGRIHGEVRANYLMSPPLVVAFALAGRIDLDLHSEPLGTDPEGQPVFLSDIWPTQQEIADAMGGSIASSMFEKRYGEVYRGDHRWDALEAPAGDRFAWSDRSTYIRKPPYFEGMSAEPPATVPDITGARAIAVLADSITTDHISPAGSIATDSPAGQYLQSLGVEPREFNSYGSRRGNHEVMVRGTFANVRIRNRLAPGTEGGYTTHLPTGEVMSIYDAAMRYRDEGTPLVVLAGKEYGSGSSRDWAAKGPALQGIRAVLAEGYERIHRSNLIGMGILPLQLPAGESVDSLGLDGHEVFAVEGLADGVARGFADGKTVQVTARAEDGREARFEAVVRLDTPMELEYFRHGGILQYVLRGLVD
jgi:aconitate hydratase